MTLHVAEDTLVFGRTIDPSQSTLVALNRSGSAVTVDVTVSASLGWSSGTALQDALGGAGATVGDGGALSITIPATGAAVLHP